MAAGLVETDEGVYVAALAAARLGALSVAVEGGEGGGGGYDIIIIIIIILSPNRGRWRDGLGARGLTVYSA